MQASPIFVRSLPTKSRKRWARDVFDTLGTHPDHVYDVTDTAAAWWEETGKHTHGRRVFQWDFQTPIFNKQKQKLNEKLPFIRLKKTKQKKTKIFLNYSVPIARARALTICLSSVSVSVSLSLSVCLSVSLSLPPSHSPCLPLCLSVCLSVSLSDQMFCCFICWLYAHNM